MLQFRHLGKSNDSPCPIYLRRLLWISNEIPIWKFLEIVKQFLVLVVQRPHLFFKLQRLNECCAPSVGSARSWFKYHWLPHLAPTILNTDPLPSFTMYDQKSSFLAHHYKDAHWEVFCSLASSTPRHETGEQIQPSEPAEEHNSDDRVAPNLLHLYTQPHCPKGKSSPTPRNFFSSLASPPIELPYNHCSQTPCTSHLTIWQANSFTGTCFYL